jgi:hypothetical protein
MSRASVPSLPSAILVSASLLAAAGLAGCGIGSVDHSTSGTLALQGIVHGGQQPVANSVVRLYSAGIGGNGTTATDMLSVSGNDYVISDANGNFSITGDYHCANASDQVYIVATGGNPGLAPGTNNAALQMVDVLGPCGNLTPNTYIWINEVTTAAAAWALAPFMTSTANVASSATNTQGLANAFLDTRLLANPSTGLAAALPSNLTVETGKLYALANVLAACVNSDGTTTGCTQLFSLAKPTYSGATAPTTTLAAALDIVKNPSHNVAALYNSPPPQSPFGSTLTAPPHDWTMSLGITGGGLSAPTQIELDRLGNVWAADYPGAISAFTAQGTPLSGSSGFGAGTGVISEVFGLTIDGHNNIWATNEENPQHGSTAGSAVAFGGAASGVNMGTVLFTAQDNSISYPESMAADAAGNVLISNYHGGSVTIYNSSYGLVAADLGSGDNAFGPLAIVSDNAGGVWMANNVANYISHVTANGALAAQPACCNGPVGIARDATGNIWVSSYYYGPDANQQYGAGSVSEVAPNGTITINQETGVGGIEYPSRLSLDAAQNVWVANYLGFSFTELAGNSNVNGLAAGAAVSPAGGYGLDANISDPYDIVPDESGNLWISSNGDNRLVMFFGLATPTATPRGPVPTAP